MKKLNSCLTVICICIMVLLSMGNCLVSAESAPSQSVSSTSDSKNVDILDLVRLKKHLTGMKTILSGADYNNDGIVNAVDLVVLKKLVFGMTVNTDSVVEIPEFDSDGYYNQVVKP